MTRILLLTLITASFFGQSCRDPYLPPVESTDKSYLVVEGVLNTGSGPATIRLSRSLKLQDTARVRPELNATVTVEGKDNSTRQLFAQPGGYYSSPGLNLTLNNEYRLRVKTVGGKEYVSDYIVARLTPAIDSIGWKQDQEGVEIYANTHDASDKTRYYRWEYDETWEIRSTFFSSYKYIGNGTVVKRAPGDDVSVCWKYRTSTNIVLGSSARLQSDIIYQAPLTFIEDGSEKLGVRYSILVRQYSLDKLGYEFYEMMKKMTEQIGTVFDPQPSEIRGNLKCITDPTELVIGYLTAASITQKRIFISRGELPNWGFRLYCEDVVIPNKRDTMEAYFGSNMYSPYEAVTSPNNPNLIIGYASSFPACVDCTTRGGSVVRPTYW